MAEMKFERNRAILQARESGKSYREISEELECSKTLPPDVVLRMCTRFEKQVASGVSVDEIASEWSLKVETVRAMVQRVVSSKRRWQEEESLRVERRSAEIDYEIALRLPDHCPDQLIAEIGGILELARSNRTVRAMDVYNVVRDYFEYERSEGLHGSYE